MIECNSMIPVMNYGSSASYKAEPSPEQIANGVIPLDSLPAAWWNCMWSQTNTAVNQARQELGQLIVELNNVLCNAGVCPQDVCTDQLYQSIEKIRQTLGNATTAGAVKSSSCPSEVAIDQTTGVMTVNCLGNAASLTTTARTVVGAVNELKSTYDCCFTDVNTAIGGKAPTAHASTATTYGVGNADCYGHLKISDTYTSVLSACSGVAASQLAVACVYCCLTTVAASVAGLGNTAGCALGTAAAGTASTAARSDHVHPITGLATVKCENGYYGLGYAGTYTGFLRVSESGLIPYASCTNGCGYLGTTTWPFLAAYAKTFYGCLCGSATTALCTCLDYFGSSADRPIIVSSASNTAMACQAAAIGPVVSANKFTYNPATGMLKLISSGKTACISHQNASYLHIYTDASCIAFNKNIYLPESCFIDRARTLIDTGTTHGSGSGAYIYCVDYNGSSEATALGSGRCLLVRSCNSGSCLHHTIRSINADCVCVGCAGSAGSATSATKSCCACCIYYNAGNLPTTGAFLKIDISNAGIAQVRFVVNNAIMCNKCYYIPLW